MRRLAGLLLIAGSLGAQPLSLTLADAEAPAGSPPQVFGGVTGVGADSVGRIAAGGLDNRSVYNRSRNRSNGA